MFSAVTEFTSPADHPDVRFEERVTIDAALSVWAAGLRTAGGGRESCDARYRTYVPDYNALQLKCWRQSVETRREDRA